VSADLSPRLVQPRFLALCEATACLVRFFIRLLCRLDIVRSPCLYQQDTPLRWLWLPHSRKTFTGFPDRPAANAWSDSGPPAVRQAARPKSCRMLEDAPLVLEQPFEIYVVLLGEPGDLVMLERQRGLDLLVRKVAGCCYVPDALSL
jgi:hypothetical protein